METIDTVILGAGAAGLFCAGSILSKGRAGCSVLVLDHAATPGEKIRISGGGRCNFTNLASTPDRFLSQNPRFAASALAGFRPQDFVALVDQAGIAWHEKTLGQLFCDGSARQIIDMLLQRMRGAELRLNTAVASVVRRDDGFVVTSSAGEILARQVVVATGGRSIPKMGATGIGYEIARSFGDPRIHIHSTQEHQTIETNWARMLNLELADYLTILGHDDVFYPEFLQTIAGMMNLLTAVIDMRYRLINQRFDLLGGGRAALRQRSDF